MNGLSHNFRLDTAVSFPRLSSTPGATAPLITGNKGNFLHIWLPHTFLRRKKKGGKKPHEPNPLTSAFFTFIPQKVSDTHNIFNEQD